MKTILTFLLFTCLALQAQNQTPTTPAPSASGSTTTNPDPTEALRRALRERMASRGSNSAIVFVETNSLAANPTLAASSLAALGNPLPTNAPTVFVPRVTQATSPAAAANPASANTSVPSASTSASAVPPPPIPPPSTIPSGTNLTAATPRSPTETRPAAASPVVGAPPGPGGPPAVAPAGVAAKPDEAAAPRAVAAGVQIPPDLQDPPTNLINFPAVDLNTFLNDFYAPVVGRTILRAATLPAPQITLRTITPLTRKELIQAFDTVLSMNLITTIPVGDKFVKVVPTTQALQEAAAFNRLGVTNLPEAGQYITHLVQLKYVKPSEIIQILLPFAKIPNAVLPIEGSQMLVIRDFAENVKRMLELIKDIDIAIPSEFISEVIPIKYALVSDISSALSTLSTGGGGTTVGATGAATGGAGGARSPLGSRASGFGRAGGMGSYPGSTLGATPGMSGMPGQPGATPFGAAQPGGVPGQPSFSDRLRSIITRASQGGAGQFEIIGPNKIIADERTNSLLVFASREDMKMIKEIISKLDVVLAQVIIEALIMEVTLNDQKSYGVSWLQQPKTTGPFSQYTGINSPPQQDPLNMFGGVSTNATGSFPSGLSWFGKYNNDFDVAVQAAASDSRVNVISRPRIQTSHAVQANIQIGTSQPIVTGSYNYYGGGPQTQFAYQNFGISLSVLPLINQEGLVVMDIDQSIQSNVGSVDVGSGLKEPVLANRSANAKVAVHTGETVMLGGFISSSVNRTKSGVPLLMDIPVLGALFRSASKSHDRTELIVLIRPTVLQTPEIAARAAVEEQARLPLVRRAEKDDLDYQDKLLRKFEKEDKEAAKEK